MKQKLYYSSDMFNTYFYYLTVTTPPKRILDVNTSLINENLVPCANVYYSGPSALKTDIKQKVTDPTKVKRQVAEIR